MGLSPLTLLLVIRYHGGDVLDMDDMSSLMEQKTGQVFVDCRL